MYTIEDNVYTYKFLVSFGHTIKDRLFWVTVSVTCISPSLHFHFQAPELNVPSGWVRVRVRIRVRVGAKVRILK